MTNEEIIAAVKKCVARLGYAPSWEEFRRQTSISKNQLRRKFGTYIRLLAASGVERQGPGVRAPLRSLFLDWAGVVRRMRKVPSMNEYKRLGKHSVRPFLCRYRCWRNVPAGMRAYAIDNKLEKDWADVLKLIAEHLQLPSDHVLARVPYAPAMDYDGPVYGRPLLDWPLSFAPTNEAGVMVLFGGLARELGFSVLRMQIGFPDGEVLREIAPNRWQRVRIEFEYESRNFLAHQHPESGCDLIICWRNNWPECPLEVIALSDYVSAISQKK